MGGETELKRSLFACIGSDGKPYELVAEATEPVMNLVLTDGTRVVRVSQGAYKVAGKGVYLWCSHPDAP
jgi:hypothetical protein